MTVPRRSPPALCLVAATLHLTVAGPRAEESSPGGTSLGLFAAASLTSVLTEILPRHRFPQLRLSFAGSSALARQIDAGAPVDLYLSASPQWMDYLQERGRIDAATRFDLLANRLVVVTPAGSGLEVQPRPGFDLAGALSGRLAVGDPDHVPAGIYARQALRALGWWPALEHRLAPAPDVRAALLYVARGECEAGVVYATDAAVSRGVRVAAELADSLHAPIRYPAAVVAGRDSPAVRHLVNRLRSREAAQVFRRHGFTVLAAPVDPPPVE